MNTRAINMQKRRDRILTEARRVIAEKGFDALNTRDLAKAAGVTAPTLYNLIGNKEQILHGLLMEAVERIEERLVSFDNAPPLEMAEAIVLQSTDLYREDENFYRAAVIASDRVSVSFGQSGGSSLISERSVQMAARASAAAISQGLLRGNVSAQALGEQMFICYRSPFRDWAFGLIDLDEFARQALRGFYMCLAADAVETFRAQLLRKIRKLTKAPLRRTG